MLVADVMDTDPAEIALDATFREAAESFVVNRTSDLVVTDAGRYVGILSEGDLLRALLPDFEPMTKSVAGVSLDEASRLFLDSGRFNADRSIASLVLKRPISLAPRDPLLKAATVMAAEHIRRLPVIEDGSVVGMLARAKISRALLSERATPASA
jgi:CBS domain-containing protein